MINQKPWKLKMIRNTGKTGKGKTKPKLNETKQTFQVTLHSKVLCVNII